MWLLLFYLVYHAYATVDLCWPQRCAVNCTFFIIYFLYVTSVIIKYYVTPDHADAPSFFMLWHFSTVAWCLAGVNQSGASNCQLCSATVRLFCPTPPRITYKTNIPPEYIYWIHHVFACTCFRALLVRLYWHGHVYTVRRDTCCGLVPEYRPGELPFKMGDMVGDTIYIYV